MSGMSELHAYITESIKGYPGLPKYRLVDMVVLHFDMPVKSAEYFVDQVIQGDNEDGHSS